MVQGGGLYHDREGTHSEAEKSGGALHPYPKNGKMEGAAELAEEKHTEMVVAGDWEEGRHPNNCRSQALGGKRVKGKSYTAVGKKDGARGIGTFEHEMLRAKHLEKRGREGAYLFTKSETGEGLSSCLSSILSSLLL